MFGWWIKPPVERTADDWRGIVAELEARHAALTESIRRDRSARGDLVLEKAGGADAAMVEAGRLRAEVAAAEAELADVAEALDKARTALATLEAEGRAAGRRAMVARHDRLLRERMGALGDVEVHTRDLVRATQRADGLATEARAIRAGLGFPHDPDADPTTADKALGGWVRWINANKWARLFSVTSYEPFPGDDATPRERAAPDHARLSRLVAEPPEEDDE